jgi:hypothetical protein
MNNVILLLLSFTLVAYAGEHFGPPQIVGWDGKHFYPDGYSPEPQDGYLSIHDYYYHDDSGHRIQNTRSPSTFRKAEIHVCPHFFPMPTTSEHFLFPKNSVIQIFAVQMWSPLLLITSQSFLMCIA